MPMEIKQAEKMLESSQNEAYLLLFHAADKIVQILSGHHLKQILLILESVKKRLRNLPNYPNRTVEELAEGLKLPLWQAQDIFKYLELANIVSLSCKFEAGDQNKTTLRITDVPNNVD